MHSTPIHRDQANQEVSNNTHHYCNESFPLRFHIKILNICLLRLSLRSIRCSISTLHTPCLWIISLLSSASYRLYSFWLYIFPYHLGRFFRWLPRFLPHVWAFVIPHFTVVVGNLKTTLPDVSCERGQLISYFAPVVNKIITRVKKMPLNF